MQKYYDEFCNNHQSNNHHHNNNFSQTRVEPKPWFQVELPYIIDIKDISFQSTNLSDFDIVILDDYIDNNFRFYATYEYL